jgi:succinate-semialdehyde dehydrogenase/glutarate-semialdehyde dehydrogenase
MRNQLYIGGQWCAASNGGTFPIFNPATEEVITEVANGTVDDAMKCVEVAHTAGKAWAKFAPRERAEILRKGYELLTERHEDISRLIVLENGKSLGDARSEVSYANEFFRWYAEEAVRNIGDVMTSPSGNNKILVMSQPVGVTVLVTPWNYPSAMATRKIGPALAAGCSVILKPASETPLTALLVAEILEEAGVPAGVMNVLPGNRSGSIVAAMLDDARVRKISFTGSTEVGRKLLQTAANTIVNCSMELGGNAPFIVFEDADMEKAVEGAMLAKLRNVGEACTAANRFIVHESIADEFAEKFAAAMDKLTVGPGLEETTDIGSLVNAETRDKVAELVEDAVSKGAKIVTGGETVGDKGFYYKPTVLTNVSADADMLVEEIFGPVAPITTFKTDEDAIDQANNTEYGLVAYVYTENLARGLRVAEELETGMLGLNRGLVSDPAAPFGGVKQSGIGREGGHEGMLEFLEKKYIAVEW